MTEAAAAALARLMDSRGRGDDRIVREIQTGQGIVDLLAVRFDDGALAHRIQAGLAPVTLPLRVQVLDALRRPRAMRIETLASRVGSKSNALRRSTLAPLEQLGAVELGRDLVRSTGAWLPVARRLTAVELKLSKWQVALRQADNAAFSADSVWVVLDEARARPALRAEHRFRLFGIGLATLSSTGRLRIISRPRRRGRVRWLHSWLGEVAWAAASRDAECWGQASANAGPWSCGVRRSLCSDE